ncbi:MAG: HPF/RaiA family ribosome-associated protein [Vicinamibacterales bacterium]
MANAQTISAQARSYAEYRLFAALTRHVQGVRRARVVLQRAGEVGDTDSVTCAVTITLDPTGQMRIRAIGPHAYEAINRAVGRVGEAMGRLSGQLAVQRAGPIRIAIGGERD